MGRDAAGGREGAVVGGQTEEGGVERGGYLGGGPGRGESV